MTFLRSFLCAVAIAASTAIAAAPPLSVDSRQRIALSAPADFHIRITVQPDAPNRTVCLHANLNGIPDVRKSCWNADGEKGAKTTWRWLKQLDSGEWDIYASVERNDGRTLRSTPIRLTVRGPGYEEPPSMFE